MEKLYDGVILTGPVDDPFLHMFLAEQGGILAMLQLRNIIKECEAHKLPWETPSFRLVHGGLIFIKEYTVCQAGSFKLDLDEVIHLVEKNADRFDRPETQRERAERERRRGGSDWTAEVLEQLDKLQHKVGLWYVHRSLPEDMETWYREWVYGR